MIRAFQEIQKVLPGNTFSDIAEQIEAICREAIAPLKENK